MEAGDLIAKFNSEHGLIIVLLTVSTYMFIESLSFLFNGRVFPMFTSAVVIVGCILLLIQNYLPKPLQKVVAEPVDIRPDVGDNQEDETEQISDNSAYLGSSAVDRPIGDILFVTIMISLLLVTSYAIGMTIPSLIFVTVYSLWFRQPWYIHIMLPAIVLILAYAFKVHLNVSIDRGVYFDVLFTGVM